MKQSKPKKQKTDPRFSAVLKDISENSMSLRMALKNNKLGKSTWLNKVNKDSDFATQYERAREERADNIFEEILAISDHTAEDHTPFTGANVVNRDRLRIDARKWMLSKMLPKKYGERIDEKSEDDNEIVVRRI